MYDVVVVGQGLSGLLSAIWSKEAGNRVALVSQGTGRIVQSTGLMDTFMENTVEQAEKSIEKFKALMNKLEFPYFGQLNTAVPIVTGSGSVKWTTLYPETITPIPEKGHVVVVGFQEIADFQPKYVKGNLQKALPELSIEALTVRLGKSSLRTMTQLDAARALEERETRLNVFEQIKRTMIEQKIGLPDLFIFPASLGVENWKAVVRDFSDSLGAPVTEAPGMPPNATAVRLFEALRKEAVKSGIRFYSDTQVVGSKVEGNRVKSLTIKTSNRTTEIEGSNVVIASGGILGGGLEVTGDGLKEQVLRLEVDELGRYVECPENVFPVGASLGTNTTHHGITGGVFSILSSYEVQSKI